MDRFHLMSVFVAVAEEESFAAAARRLRMSPPAVTRAIAFLEQRLGVRLLTRTTRLVRTTDAGARYLEDARRILLEADEADEAAAGINATPRGHLSVTAPVLFGKGYVMPVITAYQAKFQETTVSALFVDRVVNLVEEGIDAGIRIGPLPDSSLRAIRVGQVRRVVCASPAYLKKYGRPKLPADLARHTIIAATSISAGPDWTFGTGKQRTSVRLSPRVLVNTNDGALEAAREGFGLTRLMSYQVARELAAGTVETLLTEFEEAPLPVHVIHGEGRHGSAKVRSFVDLAVEKLRGDATLQ
jgi:DNA-binding transcriptional LysR family regulator